MWGGKKIAQWRSSKGDVLNIRGGLVFIHKVCPLCSPRDTQQAWQVLLVGWRRAGQQRNRISSVTWAAHVKLLSSQFKDFIVSSQGYHLTITEADRNAHPHTLGRNENQVDTFGCPCLSWFDLWSQHLYSGMSCPVWNCLNVNSDYRQSFAFYPHKFHPPKKIPCIRNLKAHGEQFYQYIYIYIKKKN